MKKVLYWLVLVAITLAVITIFPKVMLVVPYIAAWQVGTALSQAATYLAKVL